MKLLFGLLLFSFLGWVGVRYAIQRLRRLRGEPVPEKNGPDTVTIVCFALIAIYALLILYRLSTEGLSAFG